MTEVITATAADDFFRIYIDGSLHMMFRRPDLRGMNAWMEPDKVDRYKVAFHLCGIQPLVCSYSDEARWRRILMLVDEQALT